jgi:D-threo-aldose 1-dehydrogenase
VLIIGLINPMGESMVQQIQGRLGDLGLGASAFGNLYRVVSDEDSRHVVDAMWAGGVRYFDTAPHYGLGLSERRLGTALSHYPRREFVISTKVGRVLEPNPSGSGTMDDEGFVVDAAFRRRWDFTAAGVIESLSQSLERLKMDRVDVVYLHDPEEHLEVAMNEAIPALVELRDAGIVSAIGVGSKDCAAIARLINTGRIDLAMVAGRYTLLEQPAAADVLPAAIAHEVGIVAVGVYNSGILSKAVPDPRSNYDYGTVPPEVFCRAMAIAEVCNRHGIELPHAALQYPLRHPAVVNVTVGMGRPSYVPSTLERMNKAIPDALWADLAAEQLIPEEPS